MKRACVAAYAAWADVLVLGGGLAGMYAAIEAERQGRSVAILSKGKVGLSGSSLVAMSVHRFAPDKPTLREEYRKRFLASGAGQQNPSVAEFFVRHGAEAVEALKRFPVPLQYRTVPGAHGDVDYMACCSPKYGRYQTEPMRGYLVSQTNVAVDEGTMAFALVTVEGRICGVLAERDGAVAFHPAGAVVLATGGAGNIYCQTSNTSDLTGDGYAMARRAGLSLTGMEFVQFYPYRIYSPRPANIFPDLFEHGAVFRNESGERFMDAYPNRELENRDVLSRAMYRQKRVRLDLSGCETAYLARECPNLFKMYHDAPDRPILAHPVAHFFMGGIPLKTDCSTEISGLYACGEVTGGLHGANRLAGSALTEVALFGRIAGAQAALASEHTFRSQNVQRAVDAQLADLPQPGTDDLRPLRRRLQNAVWSGASVIRTRVGLARLSDELTQMSAELLLSHPARLREWLELRDLIETARCVAEAAIARTESLGAHFLADSVDADGAAANGSRA